MKLTKKITRKFVSETPRIITLLQFLLGIISSVSVTLASLPSDVAASIPHSTTITISVVSGILAFLLQFIEKSKK